MLSSKVMRLPVVDPELGVCVGIVTRTVSGARAAAPQAGARGLTWTHQDIMHCVGAALLNNIHE